MGLLMEFRENGACSLEGARLIVERRMRFDHQDNA